MRIEKIPKMILIYDPPGIIPPGMIKSAANKKREMSISLSHPITSCGRVKLRWMGML
ncbi:hypothetical protein FACS1894187_14840 [Synergistales bacterium]|nr:hypothetical protein FACS1894187_14840 [Synergistales bacterium]